jgi:hypothetical protein
MIQTTDTTVRDTEGNIVSNKEKVLQMWYEYYQKHNELQHETDNDSGEEWKMCVQTAEPPKDVQIVREMSKI